MSIFLAPIQHKQTTFCDSDFSSLFFSVKDGSDRLEKQPSYSCCNFLCIVLAATHLKYRRYHLPFVGHIFFHCDTHTHTHTHSPSPGFGAGLRLHDFQTCQRWQPLLALSSWSSNQSICQLRAFRENDEFDEEKAQQAHSKIDDGGRQIRWSHQ